MQVKERIEAAASGMTVNERKLAAVLLADYPFAGIATIQKLASRAEVSAPSITRFVSKIGLAGYQDFQRALIEELKQGQRSPVELRRQGTAIEGGYLNGFIARAAEQMQIAGNAITEAQFDKVCSLLSDPRRKVFVLGGRSSDTIAQHLSFHLRQTRKDVYHLPQNSEVWPEYLLRMKHGDVFFVVDFRRYQAVLATLAKKASTSVGARVVLMSDHWVSPIAKHAAEIIPVPTETGTLWDTYAPALAVIEAIVTRVAEKNWGQTRDRIQSWDALRLDSGDSDEKC